MLSNNEVLMEKILRVENDDEAITKGTNMFLKSLLQNEKKFLRYMRSDLIEKPNSKHLDKFFNDQQCQICNQSFDFEMEYYPVRIFLKNLFLK